MSFVHFVDAHIGATFLAAVVAAAALFATGLSTFAWHERALAVAHEAADAAQESGGDSVVAPWTGKLLTPGRVLTVIVALAVVLGVACVLVSRSVSTLRHDRLISAVEAKYHVTVDRDGLPGRGVESVWVIDGVGRACQLHVADWSRLDPIVVCDGHELDDLTTN